MMDYRKMIGLVLLILLVLIAAAFAGSIAREAGLVEVP